MLEPPSEQLQRILAEYRLCTRGDLRRCRPRVRRLAHDLPAFDSVWIDALVQAGRLTSFQARVLESAHPESLRVGPCILIDRLGRGRFGATYLARHIDRNEQCVLKRMRLSPDAFSVAADRLTQLVTACHALNHPSLVAPHVCKQMAPDAVEKRSGRPASLEPGEVILISRFVPGLTLKELLIRRGRFPPDVVWEIGRQLLDGVVAVEERGFVHGEIGLTNVRLSSRGVATLVDAGVLPAVQPELSIHESVSPDRCDGIAPERIGTGAPPTVLSDLYALGCLLWTLLAGRPPFPSGDPLAKLAAHQTRPIPDIREWSPMTPEPLARLITDLVAHDPAERPQSAREARRLWGRPGRWGQHRVRRFRAQFDNGVPKVPPPAAHRTPGRWTVLAVMIFVLSGVVLSFVDQGARAHLLKLAAEVSDRWHRRTSALFATSRSSGSSLDPAAADPSSADGRRELDPGFLPLPPPNAEGIILLDSNGPYKVADISSAGPLVLRGADDRHPHVVITDTPLRIWAEQVVLDNVIFVTQQAALVSAGSAGGRLLSRTTGAKQSHVDRQPAALLLIRSQSLAVEGCVFQTHGLIHSPRAVASNEPPHESPDATSAGPGAAATNGPRPA
ncbi:MAG TPA: serine/threonine protein kinase [Planctomycetaceae bacterium]|nr:serine/threonine protein kinase [Planctomycetaceae bacterium]